jgi:hypothetical protein
MDKIQKGYIAFIAMTILACLTILSACGPDQATPTPIAAASATPAQAGLGVDATLVPFPTLPVSLATRTPTAAENATPVITTPEAEATPTEQVEPQMVADMGFLPKPDGYSFENYAGKKKNGKPVPELFLSDLLKMFGDADVCIQVVNGKCTPRQEALDWLDMLNSQIPGGHCEGMAVSSLLLFKAMDDAANYGDGAAKTFDIKFNPKVASLISYYYYLQYVDPVASEYSLEEQSKPSEVLDKVIASMQDGAPDPVNLGFYGGEPDENGYLAGHSITPYAVEDRGNGIFWIYVYDNNWPNKFDAHMEIDRVNETWSYDLSAQNPDYEPQVWVGDADTQTLGALPISWRTGTLICPWCDNPAGSSPDTSMKSTTGVSLVNSTEKTTMTGGNTMQITLEGDGQLLIENNQGQKLGYENGKLVSQIPGARVVRPRTGKGAMQPIYFVPKGQAYNINLTGQALKDGTVGNSTLSLFGQNMSATLADITLNKGDVHKLALSADAQNLGFTAGNSTAKPTFRISTTIKSGPGAIQNNPTSYQFQVGDVDLTTGQQLNFNLNKSTAQLNLKALNTTSPLSYNLDIVRTATNGTDAFKKLNVVLNANSTHKFNFGGWKINGVSIEVDNGSNGQVDATQPVPTVVVTETPTP